MRHTPEDDLAATAPPASKPPSTAHTWGVRHGLTQVLGAGLREVWRIRGDSLQAVRMMLVLLVLCGGVYPLILFAVGQTAFPFQANGSLVVDINGQVIGSKLLAQQFTRPEYFHGRPSAAGYNAAGSSGSNLGPTNPQLINGNGTQVTLAPGATPPPGAIPVPGSPNTYYVPGSYLGVQNYADQFRKENGLPADMPLPADIVTASGSGLDPDISVAAAVLQVNRVAMARVALAGPNARATPDTLKTLIAQHTQGRDLGVLGEPRVNVLELNRALDALFGPPVPQATPTNQTTPTNRPTPTSQPAVTTPTAVSR